MMRKRIIMMLWGMIIVGSLMGQAIVCQATEQPPFEGKVLTNINLPVSEKIEEQQYLGVDGKKTFKIPEIRAELVIVEIFSMYCPFCQKEAPSVNELYRIIEQDNDSKKRIKLIGIGAGNSPFEVNTFRRTYAVAFPLFADMDFSIHEALGKVRTPYFIVIKLSQNAAPEVVYSKVGALGDPQGFLELIMKESGLKKGT
jgi:peroxiredoxin